MPISFKIVDFLINDKYCEINCPITNLNLLNIHNLFISWGLKQEQVVQIKFIINSELMIDLNKLYLIDYNKQNIIFVYVENENIKQKLCNIIENTIVETKKYVLTRDIINNMNENTLLLLSDYDFINMLYVYKKSPELFNTLSNFIQKYDIATEFQENPLLFYNNDFNKLLCIYINKPNLFHMLSNFIQKNDVIDERLPKITLLDIDIHYYNKLVDYIMNINIGVSRDIIMNKLIKYSGHLNLTIRSIFNDT